MSKPKRQHRRARPKAPRSPQTEPKKTNSAKGGSRKYTLSASRLRHYYDVRQYAILTDEAKHVLILQLPKDYDESAANTWTLPGGKLEPTDNPAEGLLREIAEETGLMPAAAVLCGLARWASRASKKLGVFYRVQVSGVQPTLKLSDEHQRAVWVPLAELEQFPFHRNEMMKMVKETLRGGA